MEKNLTNRNKKLLKWYHLVQYSTTKNETLYAQLNFLVKITDVLDVRDYKKKGK